MVIDYSIFDVMIIVLNLLIATVFGVLIGYFRKDKIHGAGSRTFALISLGACLFASISLFGFLNLQNADISRIAAGVVTGIGFIGAGVIWKHRELHGVTTAAAIWVASAVGLGVGLRMYIPALVVTLITMLILKSGRDADNREKLLLKKKKKR
ncbi:MAG: MgtC/SapB family protein [Candidatus Aenigmatarchaeota archaeon]